MDLKEHIRALPKAELHLHLEGTLEPELMMRLAARNKVEIPFRSVEEIRAAYRFTRLQDFLDIYYRGMEVLRAEEDFHELTRDYLERAAADGAVHVEVFFDPQGHTARGIPFAVAADGIVAALAEGRERLGITSLLIMSSSGIWTKRTDSPPFTRPGPILSTGGSPVSASIRPRGIIRPQSSNASSPRRGKPASGSSPMPARKARPPMSSTRLTGWG